MEETSGARIFDLRAAFRATAESVERDRPAVEALNERLSLGIRLRCVLRQAA